MASKLGEPSTTKSLMHLRDNVQQCQQALKQATMFHESVSRHFLFLGSDVPLVFKKYIRHRVSCMFNLSAVFLIVEHQSTAKQFGF